MIPESRRSLSHPSCGHEGLQKAKVDVVLARTHCMTARDFRRRLLRSQRRSLLPLPPTMSEPTWVPRVTAQSAGCHLQKIPV